MLPALSILAMSAFLLSLMPAYAQDTMSIGNSISIGGLTVRGPSTVTIAPTDRPGALAQVTFDNVAINDEGDTGTTGTISLGGLSVDVRFEWNADFAGSDMVTITPPDGVLCWPRCTILIAEDSQATIWLFSHEGFGS